MKVSIIFFNGVTEHEFFHIQQDVLEASFVVFRPILDFKVPVEILILVKA